MTPKDETEKRLEAQRVRDYLKFLPSQCLQASAVFLKEDSGDSLEESARYIVEFASVLMNECVQQKFFNWASMHEKARILLGDE